MELLSSCPVCQGTTFSEFMTCKDYTVSHETFHLHQCRRCGFVFTNPRPEEEDLPLYYESKAYVSHSERSVSTIDRLYKIARSFTLQWKWRLIQQHHSTSQPKSILDYGCGTGAFLQQCQRKNIQIGGVEPSSTARAIAARNTGINIHALITDVPASYDVITLWHVLEHVTNLEQTINQLKQRLNQKGTLFIAVPNLSSVDAKKYGEYWAAYDVPRHLWHFSRNTMTRLLDNFGLHVSEVLPMPLDAYYVALLSEKYRTANGGLS